jgi:hypothetical protein
MFVPPATVPTLSVGLPNSSCSGPPKSKLSSRPIARASLWTALSPRCGIEPWALRPLVAASIYTTPLWARHG